MFAHIFQIKKIYANIIAILYVEDDKLGYDIFETIEIVDSSNYDNLILYDTEDMNYKILCLSKKGNSQVKCYSIYVDADYDSYSTDKYHKNLIKEELQSSDYSASISKIHKCYMAVFYSEFLLCCGNNNKIHCYRNNINNFDLINEFSLTLPGDITNVIIANKNDHAIISYNNESLTNNYLYQYYIYPPKCQDTSLHINSSQPFEINLSNLFEIKTNTKYYFIFLELPLNYGTIKLGEDIINSINEKIEYMSEKENLTFYLNNNKMFKNFDFIYNISITETYSSVCKITLINDECYHSCKNCSEDILTEINENQHYCINCKEEEGYFPYTDKPSNNCYNEQEMNESFTQWFFDEEGKTFERKFDKLIYLSI